jgi:hypothetical protein
MGMIYSSNKKNLKAKPASKDDIQQEQEKPQDKTGQDQSAKGAKNTSLFTYNYTHATCQI